MKPSDRIIAEAEHMLNVVLPPGARHDTATRAEALARATLAHIDRDGGAPDVYRDTDQRYQHDPAFRAAVSTLEAAAREHGFTPGELRQIAFKAALNLEMRLKPLISVARTEAPAELPKTEDEGHEPFLP